MSQEALRAFLRSIPRRPDQVPSSGKLTMEQGIRRYSALAQSTAAHIERWNPGFRRLLGGIQPAHMALAMARRETDFDAGAQNAGSRATGILQVRPSTARELLEDRSLWPDLNDAQFRALSSSPQAIERALFRPEICMRVGLAYFSQMLEQQRGNVTLALASYNAGPGNVRRAGNRVPANAETQQYVRNIPLYARQVAQLSDRIIG